MSLPADFALDALLGEHLFPTKNESKDEIPPVFSSKTFSSHIAAELTGNAPGRKHGYDAVDCKLTRFTGVPRICAVPHPVAHARLASCIHDNWDQLAYIAHNPNSAIRPRQHSDGRLIVMSYDHALLDMRQSLGSSFGKRFLARTDIANFFPSIYSHAIPWALVGHDNAKRRTSTNEWFNVLDKYVRSTKRNETNGILIGPGTSFVVAEVILARIDAEMRQHFTYKRYIDDYTAYCETEEEAQRFIRELSQHLAQYKLLLNINKTQVVRLPQPLASDWVSELTLTAPERKNASTTDALRYLDAAVKIAQKTPDGSVLKYATKMLLGRHARLARQTDVFQYVLGLAFHQPAILPVLNRFLDAMTARYIRDHHGSAFNAILLDNAKWRRTDGMSWALYFLHRLDVAVADECAREMMQSRDCMALLLLYLSGEQQHRDVVVKFANGIDSDDLYECDRYWLLRYELFRAKEHIRLTAGERRVFEILADGGVSFLDERQFDREPDEGLG